MHIHTVQLAESIGGVSCLSVVFLVDYHCMDGRRFRAKIYSIIHTVFGYQLDYIGMNSVYAAPRTPVILQSAQKNPIKMLVDACMLCSGPV